MSFKVGDHVWVIRIERPLVYWGSPAVITAACGLNRWDVCFTGGGTRTMRYESELRHVSAVDRLAELADDAGRTGP